MLKRAPDFGLAPLSFPVANGVENRSDGRFKSPGRKRQPAIRCSRCHRSAMTRLPKPVGLLLFMVLNQCSAPTELTACGESFCFPKGVKVKSWDRPYPGTNIYVVEVAGQEFRVYEGDSSTRSKGGILIRIGDLSPKYLQVSGRCSSQQNCELKSFARQLSPRDSPR